MFINGVWGAPMIEKGINAGYALFPSDNGKSVACESACLDMWWAITRRKPAGRQGYGS